MIRLDKMLANIGFGTRKEVKKIIKDKRVLVNDVLVTKDDFKIDENLDKVIVDGILIDYKKFVYIMLNKPDGYLSANEDGQYPTVFDLIDDKTKGLFCVGRLDIDTEGLLLITNDGDLAHNLLSPKKHVAKKYYVEISNPLTKEHIDMLENSKIILDDEVLKKAKVELINDHALYLTITEGKYHQVKRMISACQSEVTYLKRVAMGSLLLDPLLKVKEYRYLTDDEISQLRGK